MKHCRGSICAPFLLLDRGDDWSHTKLQPQKCSSAKFNIQGFWSGMGLPEDLKSGFHIGRRLQGLLTGGTYRIEAGDGWIFAVL